jgi:hypothetical protein
VTARRGHQERRTLPADDAKGHGLLEAEGLAQGQNKLADAEAVGVVELRFSIAPSAFLTSVRAVGSLRREKLTWHW